MAILAACHPDLVFDQYKPISNRNWNKDSVLVFTIPVTDTTSNHNIYLNVRNDVNYEYSNLWLFVTIEQIHGNSINDKFDFCNVIINFGENYIIQ